MIGLAISAISRTSYLIAVSLLLFFSSANAHEETPSIFTESNCMGSVKLPSGKPPVMTPSYPGGSVINIGDVTLPPINIQLPPAKRTIDVCGSGGNPDDVLKKAIANAQPGDRMVLCDREWKPIVINQKKGTAAEPIVITAENPAIDNGAAHIMGVLNIEDSENWIIDGLLFSDRAYMINVFPGSKNVQFSRNRLLDTSPSFANLGGYGLRVHGPRTEKITIVGNLFEGFFNHTISIKDRVASTYIVDNTIVGCGFECIDLGQVPDGFQGIRDMTCGVAIVTKNRIYGKNPGSPNGGVGIRTKNIAHVEITENTFSGFFRAIYHNTYGSVGKKHVQTGNSVLYPSPPLMPTQVIVKNNNFGSSGQIQLTGRGVANDKINITNNTGSVSCKIGNFSHQGGVEMQYMDKSKVYMGPPIVTQSGNSFTCH